MKQEINFLYKKSFNRYISDKKPKPTCFQTKLKTRLSTFLSAL